MDYKFTLVIKNINNTGGVVEQLLALFDVSYISIEAETGQLVTPYEEYPDEEDPQSFYYDEDGNLEDQVDLDAAEAEEMDTWYVDDDGNWQYGPESESDIDTEHSAFVGVPKDDETIIPHHVALEIARSLEDEEEKTPVKPPSNIYKEQVVGTLKNSNLPLTFDSVYDAANKTGTRPDAIARVLRGERKTANGWEWHLATEKVLPSSAAHQAHGTIYGGLPHGTKE